MNSQLQDIPPPGDRQGSRLNILSSVAEEDRKVTTASGLIDGALAALCTEFAGLMTKYFIPAFDQADFSADFRAKRLLMMNQSSDLELTLLKIFVDLLPE